MTSASKVYKTPRGGNQQQQITVQSTFRHGKGFDGGYDSSSSEEEVDLRQRKAPPQQKSPSAYDRRAAYQKASGKNPAFYGYDRVQS